jgi:hypothetical protein
MADDDATMTAINAEPRQPLSGMVKLRCDQRRLAAARNGTLTTEGGSEAISGEVIRPQETPPAVEPEKLAFEREKWEVEQRRLDREFELREKELACKLPEARRSRWWNPIMIAHFWRDNSRSWECPM